MIILHDDKSMRSIIDVVFHNGILWASSDTLGIYRYDGNEWSNFNQENSDIPSYNINKLAVDSSGMLWATFREGVFKFDGSNFVNYNNENSILPEEKPADITVDSKNNIWLTFNNNGLFKFNGEEWVNYNFDLCGLPDNRLSTIIAEKDTLWIVSAAAMGIFKYDGSDFERFYKENSGLPTNGVTCIAIDDAGNKWIGTAYNGVVVYREGGVILGVEEGGSPAGKTAPNPAEQTVNIEYTLATPGNVSIEVYTSAGSPAGSFDAGWQEEGGNNYIIPLSNFPSGSYYYKVRCGKQLVNGSFIVRK